MGVIDQFLVPIDAAKIVTAYSAEVPYTALWYNNYGYYAGINATFPQYQRPMGVERAGKIYIVWCNAEGWNTICVFNCLTGEFEGVKKIAPNIENNGHRNPTIMIDENGYIFVFGWSHGDNTQVWCSSAPYSIAEFVRRGDITGVTTYPQPHDFGTYKRVFYRSGNAWGTTWSNDGFATNGGFRKVISGTEDDRAYALTESDGQNLSIMWTGWHSTQKRMNIYFARSEDGGLTFRTAAGADLTLPIAYDDTACLVLDTGAQQVNIQDAIYFEGEPVLLFSQNTGVGVWKWKAARFVSGAPVISTIPATGDRQFDCGCFIVDAGVLRAILPTGPGQAGCDGGNLEEYRSADGGATWCFHAALTDNPFNHNNVKRVQGGCGIRAFWGYGDAGTVSSGHLKFLSGDDRVEAIRPGNPFAIELSISDGDNILYSRAFPNRGVRVVIDTEGEQTAISIAQ